MLAATQDRRASQSAFTGGLGRGGGGEEELRTDREEGHRATSGRPELGAGSRSPGQALEWLSLQSHPLIRQPPSPLPSAIPDPVQGVGGETPLWASPASGCPHWPRVSTTEVSWAMGDLATGASAGPDEVFQVVLLLRNLLPSTSRASPAPCLSQGLRWPRSPPHPWLPPPCCWPWASVAKESGTGAGRCIAFDPGMIPDSAETLEGRQSQGLL